MSLLLMGAGSNASAAAPSSPSGDDLANFIGQATGIRAVSTNCPMYRRIPILVKAANGDFLLFTQLNAGQQDSTAYAIIMKRSTDRGRTWGADITVYNYASFSSGAAWIALGSVAVDTMGTPGNIFCLFTIIGGAAHAASSHTVHVVGSIDHGATWGAATDINSSVKVTGAGAPTGHGFPATAWTFCVPTCTAAIQIQRGAQAGWFVVPFDHRTTDYTSTTTTRSHVVFSEDYGATWKLSTTARGGLDEDAANNGANECSITETATTDRLVMHIRNLSPGLTRYQSVSTDGGHTWSDQTALTGMDCGVASGTSSDVKQCKNMTIAVYSGDIAHVERTTLYFAYSLDDGATWAAANRRILARGCYAGYSSMMVDGDDIYVAYESARGTATGSGISLVSVHGIQIFKTNRQWLLNPTQRYSQWFFNEEASGTACETVGGSILDHGGLDVRAIGATVAAPPSYSANGITTAAGTADKIQLCPAAVTTFDMTATDSLTVEVEATITAGQTGVLACKYSANAGWQLEIEAVTGKLMATIGDGTLTPQVKSVGAQNSDGLRHVFAFRRSVTADNIDVLVDGVSVSAAAIADSTTTSLVQANVPLTVGDNNGGTLPITAEFHSVKITRGLVSTYLSGTQTKRTKQQLRGYTAPTLAFPTLAAGTPELFLFQTHSLGLDAYSDLYCSESYPVPMPWSNSLAVRSFRDGSPRRKRYYNSEGSRILTAMDANMGPCFDMDRITSGNGRMINSTLYGATDGHDYIQNTGQFTVCFAINIKASTTASQVIFSTNDAAASPGIYLYRVDGASSKLTLYTYGPATQINESLTNGPSVSYATSYFIAIVGQGTGAKVKVYWAPLNQAYNASSPYTPTLSSGDSTANFGSIVGAPFTTGASSYPFIGGRLAATHHLNAYIKNFMLFNTSLSQADVQLLANFSVAG